MKTKLLQTSYIFIFLSFFISLTSAVLPQQKTNLQSNKKKTSKSERSEDNQRRLQYEFEMLRDPATNKIPKNIRKLELEYAKTLPKVGELGAQYNLNNYSSAKRAIIQNGIKSLQSLSWTQLGPDNQGGKTRALAIDVSDNIIILAGGVSGGMWRSIDGGATWAKTTSPDQLQSVTCIAQDTRTGHTNTFYYGTGESVGNSTGAPGAFYYGNGIYKSTDDGISWTLLSSTASNSPQTPISSFDIVWDLATDPSNSKNDIVYAAIHGGIERSTDGGTTWTAVLGNIQHGRFTDVIVTKNGVVYATISSDGGSNAGIWKSTTGMSGSFKNITPAGFPSHYRRIVLDAAPSDENQICFLADTPDSGTLNTSLWKYVAGNTNPWTNLSAHIPAFGGKAGNFDSQGSYNLLIKVKPDDPNFVIIGGTNLYRSENGFNSDISNPGDWIGGYNSGNKTFYSYPNHHPDQHALVFLPTNPKVVYSANDGGISKTADITASSVQWTKSDKGYITSQFYSVAMDESANGDNVVIGGLQDNGNLFTNSNYLSDWKGLHFGGDGGITAIANNKNYYYISTNSHIERLTLDNQGKTTSTTEVTPQNASDFLFVPPYVLDPNNSNMMYLAAGSYIWRNSDLSAIPNYNYTATAKNWTKMTNAFNINYDITAIGVSKSPGNILYYGTSHGKVFRVNNANTGDPKPEDIWSVGGFGKVSRLSKDAYVISIAVDPDNANNVMVVFSNYGVVSLYYSSNGGDTWYDVSGNLEQNIDGSGDGPSIRWATILYEHGSTFYFVATSTGIYSTSYLADKNTIWAQEGANSIGNLVSMMIKSREPDGKLIVATHGGGVYSSNLSTGAMSGIYTINRSGSGDRNFKTFTDAVNALKTYHVSGPVAFNVADGQYWERITIPSIPGVDGQNTITFQSKSAHRDKVVLTIASDRGDNWVIKLDGAGFIRFIDMTIYAQGHYGTAVVFQNQSHDVNFYLDIIKGDSSDSSHSDNYALVYSGSNPVNNIVFKFCTFQNGVQAIKFNSSNQYKYSHGLRIVSDIFEYIRGIVIDISHPKRAVISDNTIIKGLMGIRLLNGNDVEIRRNKIREISFTGIEALHSAHLLISNNFIRSKNVGMDLNIDTSMVYYNSVDISGANPPDFGWVTAFHLTSSSNGENKIENNIFSNELGGTAYYVDDLSSGFVSDYNDFYSNGRYLIHLNQKDYPDLKSLQVENYTEFHSVYAKPLFFSSMTPQSDWVAGKADPSVNNIIEKDIFGNARNAGSPSIGAVEYHRNGTPLSKSSYTIGATGDYKTFNDAVHDLIKRGISSSITFNVEPGIYNEQIHFTVIPGLSSKDTLVFKAAKENQASITFDTTYVVAFNNVNHITFSGLTFKNTGHYKTNFKYELHDILIGQNVNHFTFYKCSFIGIDVNLNDGYLENYSDVYSHNAFADSNTFIFNTFLEGGFGINFYKSNSYGTSNLTIGGNAFYHQAMKAVSLSYEDSPFLYDNYVDSTQTGIELDYCKNVFITGNEIFHTSYQGIRLYGSHGSRNSLALIDNNIVEGANYGIHVQSSDTLHLYDNSINIDSTPGNGSYTAAISFESSHFNELRNNIFANKSGGFALYTENNSAIYSSDYNDFFTNGKVLINGGGEEYFDLKTYTAAQNKDLHSLHAKPLYRSLTDLTPQSGWINNKGDASINNIEPLDIWNIARSNTPDIGAVEYDPGANSSPLSKQVYIIGTGGDYATFNDAVYDLTKRGIAKADTFKVKPGTYHESVYFTAIPGTNDSNSIVFESESGNNNDAVISDTTSYILEMNNIHNITFHNLTMINSGKFDYNKTQKVVALGSNVDNDVFSHNILQGVKTDYNDLQHSIVTGEYIENHNDIFKNNKLINGTFGIFIFTSSDHSAISNLQIIQNQFLSQSPDGDAIFLVQVESPHIIDNFIDTAKAAINLISCTNDIEVLRNKIEHVQSGIMLYGSKGTKTAGLIANNFIQSEGYGISMSSTTDSLNILYNSVDIVGNPENTNGVAFELIGSNDVIKDNIFVNSGKGYALMAMKNSSVSDYNDYYTNGSKLIFYSKDYSDLSSYSAVVNQEQYSTSDSVTFKSLTDLHLSGNSVSDALLSGTPVSTVVTDIDGEKRSDASPFMGADEPAVGPGGIIYVDKTAHGADDGAFWKDAFVNLQDALAAANPSGTIWVAKDTYKPDEGSDITTGRRDFSFELRKTVQIYGGFSGTESHFNERDWIKNQTILSGNIGSTGDRSDNSYHVVLAKNIDTTAILDGFIITGGNANGKSYTQQNGGGIYDSIGGTLLRNLIIKNNYAKYYGGGIYNYNSNIKLKKVIFNKNSAKFGGGIYSRDGKPQLDSISFIGDSASQGGGGMYNDTADAVLHYVDFQNNKAGQGGGLYNYASSPSLKNVEFNNNSASSGGGIVNDFNSNANLVNVKFVHNHAGTGGGMGNFKSNPFIVNALFLLDSANYGGGINNVESSPHIINVTFTENIARLKGGGIFNGDNCHPILVNIILWNNTAKVDGNELFNQNGGSQANFPVFTHSLIEGSGGSGAGWNKNIGIDGSSNLDIDPLFISLVDLHLSPDSPAINAGINDSIPAYVKTDLEGNKRVVDDKVDLGAYEYQSLVDIRHEKAISKVFTLYQNYPNPFNPVTTIKFYIPKTTNVKLVVYNLFGQKVITLADGYMEAGTYTVIFNGDYLTNGIYLYRITMGNFVSTKRMLLIK